MTFIYTPTPNKTIKAEILVELRLLKSVYQVHYQTQPPLKYPVYCPDILLTLNIYNAMLSACCPVAQGDSDRNKVLN